MCVNTVFLFLHLTVIGGDSAPQKFDRLASAKMAREEGLVAGSFRHEASIARLEHQPGLAGKPGIAAAEGAGL